MSQSQKVLVAGTGLSGISAAKLLLDMGGEVVLYDSNPDLDAEELKHKFDEDAKITIVLGELKRTDLLGVEMCVISPGIPLEAPFVAVLDEAKIPIWSEIQLAYQCAKGRLAAITGTNGKTTTTALTGEIMKAHYESVFVVGNIGIPYTQVALETEDDSVTVAEVSSFQLETIMDFRPNVSAILNITPDHLNRHHTMECYIAVKESITSNQTEEVHDVVANAVAGDEQLLGHVLDIVPRGVAAEQDTNGTVNQLANELVAHQGNNVGVEGLDVSSSPDRSGNSADSLDHATTNNIGHFVLCDNRVVCRHHHNELLPSND